MRALPPSVQVVGDQSSASHTGKVLTFERRAPGDLRVSAEACARREFIAHRHELEWSQVETALRIGCSKSSVEDWERGAVTLPAWALQALKLLLAGSRRVAA
jgi:DNA-binding transcriptional regulator YiaG